LSLTAREDVYRLVGDFSEWTVRGGRASANGFPEKQRSEPGAMTTRILVLALSASLSWTSLAPADATFGDRLAAAALERTRHTVVYDGSYRGIPYPNGDVPPDRGVCTDLVIRCYRALGIDLQQLVHKDMRSAFSRYPNNWGLHRPDPNIDHRRVPNLQRLFERHGQVLRVSTDPSDYRTGELVTWTLPGNLPHIGIVTGLRSEDRVRPLIVHNIGQGPRLEDMLFDYPITGHYRYEGESSGDGEGR